MLQNSGVSTKMEVHVNAVDRQSTDRLHLIAKDIRQSTTLNRRRSPIEVVDL